MARDFLGFVFGAMVALLVGLGVGYQMRPTGSVAEQPHAALPAAAPGLEPSSFPDQPHAAPPAGVLHLTDDDVATAAPAATGRYKIVINPNVRADTFLLDTQTGRVWVHTQFTDVQNTPTVWMYEDRIDSRSQMLDWMLSHKLKRQSR